MNGDVNGEVNGHESTNGINGHGVNGESAKPSLRLSFAEYKRISNLLVLHLRHAEEGEHSVQVLAQSPSNYYALITIITT